MYKVVIADDEHRVKVSVRSIIETEDCGFKVVGEASNGTEALELTKRFQPDLLITDIRMPGLNGLELISELRERNNRCEVVILSGYDDFSYAQKAIRLGAANYLLKPIDPECLLGTLSEARGKLQKAQSQISEKLDWVRTCNEAAIKMTDLLWHLNERDVEQALTAFMEAHLKNEEDPLVVIEKNFAYLSFINEEFKKRGFVSVRDEELRNIWSSDAAEAQHFLRTYVTETIETIKRSRNFGASKIMREASSYIEQHYTNENLSLEEVSRVFEMSPSYFSYSFKQEKGISFIHYVTRLRMEKAKTLLDDPCIKVYEAGHAVGYTDYAHFAKAFKKYCNLTPSEYRNHMCVK